MKHFNTLRQLLLIPLLVLMASLSSFAQPLSGVYTIGGTSPNYATLAAAVSDLNTRGVSSPVWFKIRTGTYSSTTNWVGSINDTYTGATTHRVTFESESGVASDVNITNANTSSVNYIFRFNSAKNITVRNMTLQSSSTSYGHIIEMVNTGSNDSVYGCTMGTPATTSTSTNLAVIYGSSHYGSNNVFRNNQIVNGSYGVYWFGYSTSPTPTGDVFMNNTFTNPYRYGIYTYYSSNLKLRNNVINRGAGAAFDGIYIYYGQNALEVTANTITVTGATSTLYGINYNYSTSTAAQYAQISGNTLNLTGTSTLYSMYGNSCYYYNMNGNTITTSNTTGSTYHYPVYFSTNGTFNGNTITSTATSSGAIYNYGIYYGTNFTYNGNTITQTGTTGSMYDLYNNGSYYTGNTMSGNTITGTTTSGSHTNYYVYYLYNMNFTNNTITATSTTGSISQYLYYYANNVNFTGNTIKSTCASSCLNYAYYTNNITFKNNTIEATSTGTGTVYGLYAYNSGYTGGVFSGNKFSAKGTSGTVYGFQPYYHNSIDYYNNVFNAGGTGTVYSVYPNYSTNCKYYNNTINSNGTGTSFPLYVYQYPTTPAFSIDFKNNVISNSRSANPAVRLAYADPLSGITMDYNNLYSNTTTPNYAVVNVQYTYNTGYIPAAGSYTLQQWRGYNFDRNSLAFNPGYRDSSIDLRPDPAKPESWSVNGRGVHMTGNNLDILGNTRVTAKNAGVPDLGAYEFTPTSTPPLATPNIAPAASTTQVFTFGRDTVLVVDWPATPAPPTSLDVRQYTGTVPPGITSLSPSYMWFYVDADPGAGSFTSSPKVYYKDPWTGSTSESALRMAQKIGAAAWFGYPHTTSGAEPNRNYIYANNMPSFGFLTGVDIANNAGATDVTDPTPRFCAGTYTLKAKIKNLGNNTINNVQVGWSIDGVAQSPISYNTAIPTIASGGSNEAVVTMGSITFTNKAKIVKVFTYSPNGVTDPVPSDDTVTIVLGPGLAGEYTVGGTTPDYATVADAVAALTKFGVCGPVWFNIRTGSYTGPFVLKGAQGMSAVNRVTFRSESGAASNVTLTSTAANTVTFDNASYYTLKNVSIVNTTTTGSGVQLSKVSSFDSISGCNITIGTGYPAYGVWAATDLTGNTNVIKGNTIQGGYYAMYLYSYNNLTNYVIDDNTLIDFYYYGIQSGYYNNYDFRIRNNNISSANNYVYGIYMYYPYGTFEMTGNKIHLPGYAYSGIIMYYGNGTAANPHIIANNVITCGGTGTYAYGLSIQYSAYTRVHNNSVNWFGTGTTNTAAAYFYNYSTYNNNEIRNNVFENTGGNVAMMPYSPVATGDLYDYNNLYTTGSKLIMASNNTALTYDSLTLWRIASGNDMNSISYDPGFLSQTNLQPDVNNAASWSLNGRGTHIAGNNKDFNGNARVVNRADGVPDIGAYEFVPQTIPPVAKAIPATVTAGATQTFTFGQDTVATIKWDPTTVVPAGVTVRQYTGTKPPAFPTNGHMYFYTDIDAIPVTYIMDANIYYKDPWTGKIPAAREDSIRLLRKESSTTPWTAYNGTSSILNKNRNIITGPVLTGLGYFTGIEKDSVFSANIRPMSRVVFCAGGSVTLQSGYTGTGYTYQWLVNGSNITGANGSSYTAVSAGDYSVRVTDAANSSRTVVSNKVAVTIVSTPAALVTPNGPTTICSGNTVTLNANGGSGLSYQWVKDGIDVTGANTSSLFVADGGNYSVKVSNIGCTNISAPIVIVKGPVNVFLGQDTAFCARYPLTLDAHNPGAKYTWSTGDTTQTIIFNQYGNRKIWVHVNAGGTCIAKDTIEVDISPMPSVIGISSIRTSGNTYKFEASGPQNVESYLWVFGDGSTDTTRTLIHEYNDGTPFTLKLVVFNGCGSDTAILNLPVTVKDVTNGSEFNLYPNPAQANITLSVTGSAMFNDISIVNAIGQIVLRQTGTDNTKSRVLDVHTLPDGHYLIRANTNDGKIISKPFQIIR